MLYVGYRKQVVLAYLREGIMELQRGEDEKAIPLLENVRRSRVVEAEAQAIGLLYLGEVTRNGSVRGGKKPTKRRW
jgi:hypothetical protein